MPKISLRILCLVTTILCIVQRSLEHGIPRRSFLSRRAIDGTRGRKYFDPNEDGAFDSYGSAGGQYDPYDHITDLSDIRKNVPGEPWIDYPAYTTLPQTGFTCEGRSRGYYADEAAGCQVFHVCHDVLVSSFLCPIGSTFSQKLLTCDWWTKVDCSSTKRYFEVNRDSYQIDDDEMIRNAYAMISLQTSAEDVTRDGLVDPDSGTRIIDYSALGGRTVMGYTPGFRRITDYPPVEATGNDLPSGFEDYSQQDARQILNYDQRYQQKKISTAYQGKLHLMENKGRSPYHASAIIQHDYQDRSGDNEFQDDYRRPDGFTNRLQTSYAPTVPTVTTTTRRLYSPTVPTTYRPSTLAYSKLDLMVDSSDHLYAHSKSPMTPPTITHQNDNIRKIDLRESETGHDDLKKSENASSSRTNKDQKGDDVRSKNDEVRLDFEERNFRINVTDAIDEDEVFRQQNDRPVIQIDSEDSLEDIETRDSIGIARALNNPLDRIIQNQYPIYQVSKNERKSSTIPIPLQTVLNYSSASHEKADDVNSSDTLKKSDVFNDTDNNQSTEDYEDISSLTTRSFGHRTTPLLKRWEQKDVDVINNISTISMTVIPAINTTERSVDAINGEIAVRDSSNYSHIVEDQSSSPTGSISNFNDESVHKRNFSFEIPQPAQFLKPPAERFLIKVPEETHYTTIDENSKASWNSETATTEIPRFSSTLAGNNEDQSPIYDEELIDYTDESFSETPNSEVHSTQVVTEVSTSIPWLVSTWYDRSIVNVPVTDIVPPIVDYNDGFHDFVPPNEPPYTEQFDHTEPVDSQRAQNSPTSKKNESEADILTRYNSGFKFTIRDAINAQKESRANSRCSSVSDKQGGRCETSFVTPQITVSTPSMKERTVSIGSTKATTKIPGLIFSSGTKKSQLPEESVTLVPNKFSITSTAKSSINTDIEDSNLKTVTPRDVLEIKDSEEETEQTVSTTANSLLHSIRPESLKQIEETIDKHDSPYQVSFTVKKNEDLETTSDDFISRLIAQHQRPDSVSKDDFEVVKSVEPETKIVSILQTPKFPASHASPGSTNNNSFHITENDTVSEFKTDSNMSMVDLLQLMAKLLKLDRLPRPFSATDLRNAELKDTFHLDLDESSYDTESPLLDPQTRTTYKNVNSEPATLDTPTKLAESKMSRNLQLNKVSFATGSPRLDHLQAKTPFGNVDSKISSLADTLKVPTNVDLEPSFDVSSRISPNNVTQQKTGQSKPENRITRPLQKEEILEQLTENIGQPLYRGEPIRESLVFDLPQVQRSLDFETGLPIEEGKHTISETEEESSISTTQRTTTTTEYVKTTVETEFVPSLGFSLDTNEGREEYVQAVLGGLLDEHTGENNRNESSTAQNETPKNETLETEK